MHPVISWLMTDARRHAEPNAFLEAFAGALRAADVDVSRITTVSRRPRCHCDHVQQPDPHRL